MKRCTRRQVTVWLAAGGALPFRLAAQPPEAAARAPQVNLRVEVRQTERSRQQSLGVDRLRGAEANERRGEGGVQQQLLVLNGGRGSLRLAQGRLLRWLQRVPGPGGWTLRPAGTWVEAGQGFVVQPHWPGGGAPVTVEIAAEGGGLRLEAEDPGRRRTSQLLTTVQLPLGEWVTVAESADRQQHRERGLGSVARDEQGGSLEVQMRVTAP